MKPEDRLAELIIEAVHILLLELTEDESHGGFTLGKSRKRLNDLWDDLKDGTKTFHSVEEFEREYRPIHYEATKRALRCPGIRIMIHEEEKRIRKERETGGAD